MAESITYADLRFVKSPLKKTLSARLKQDPEVDEDGELTYENVQVPSAKDVFPSPAQPGLGGQTGGEKPVAVPYSVTSPIARRILPWHAQLEHTPQTLDSTSIDEGIDYRALQWPGPVAWIPYILLSLLGSCLLLGVTTVSLGIQYMQISHQLRNTKQVLEVTNGSLWQQLQMEALQLSRKEEDLQTVREKLNQTQQSLEVEKEQHQDAQDHLLTCRSERNNTQLSLRNNMEEKRNLEEKLKTLQSGLKKVQSFLTCQFRNNVCLSCQIPIRKIINGERTNIFWIIQKQQVKNKQDQDQFLCPALESYTISRIKSCFTSLPFICEKEAITQPVEMEDHLFH